MVIIVGEEFPETLAGEAEHHCRRVEGMKEVDCKGVVVTEVECGRAVEECFILYLESDVQSC